MENVTIKNGNGYAIVANGSTVTVDGLITENNSWGGINVDSKSGAASLTIKDADISENNSVKIENSASGAKPDDPAVEIRNGSFQHITKGGEIDKPNLTISGGKFATDSAEGAINVKDYLAPGLSISSDGTVYRPSTGGGGSVTTYPVTVSSADNGAVTVSPKNASKGSTVTVTVTPDEGYKLNTLTVKDKDGNAVELKDAGDGKYTFTMPSGKVTVEASFAEASQEPEPSGLPFTDVAASAWYREAVEYVYDNGMMKGTSDTIFSPDATTTRGMIVTMLYRLEGEPTASAASSFSDVKADDYYADAVSWAAENSIVNGVSATSYAPDDPITREQMAAILYRYAQFKGYDVTASADLSAYTDTSEISAYAVPAMQWANAEGLVTGRTNTTLDPEGDATRAEIATIMTRFCETIAK